MSRILITGSTTGLGLAAARALLEDGHRVVLHARDPQRARDIDAVADRADGVVLGDLSDPAQTRALAEQVNDTGPLDAVIHNAGVYADDAPNRNADGHPRVLAVNVLAPFVLTALIHRPARLVYLTSDMHTSGQASLDDLDWQTRSWDGTQAYRDSKLLIATLSAAVARRWPDVTSNSVDPGWVPTRMGGPRATDDLVLGHQTQVWLATSDEPAAATTGAYWYHRHTRSPAAAVSDTAFQDDLIGRLTLLTGVEFPPADDDCCYLTTVGRRSGRPHRIEIWYARDGRSLSLLAGGGYGSDWVRNLTADPTVDVEIHGVTLAATARVIQHTDEAERARSLVFDKYQPRSTDDLSDWRRRALPVALDLRS